jgi:hypothetical protein
MWMNTLQKMGFLAYVIHKIKEWFRAHSENRDAVPMINASLFDCYNQHGCVDYYVQSRASIEKMILVYM